MTVSGTVAPASGNGDADRKSVLEDRSVRRDADVLALTNGAYSGTVRDLPGGQYKLPRTMPVTRRLRRAIPRRWL